MKHGGKRKGSGRKPLNPKSKTIVVPVSMTETQRDKARRIGDGNVSAGVRKALDKVQLHSDFIGLPHKAR